MRVCGIEIKGSEAILCLMEYQQGLYSLPDCRQIRLALSQDQSSEQVRKFHFAMQKLVEDYSIKQLVIKERPQKGKFAGGAVGFKIEALLQLIEHCDCQIISATQIKEQLKRFPLPVDFKATGLKAFQETAFITAYAFLAR